MFENNFKKMKSVRGVGEWAGYSYNCGMGCSHGCRYCYSGSYYIQEGIVADRAAWMRDRPNRNRVAITKKVDKAIQFPSAHDVTPTYLETYCRTLGNILDAGNRVLLVSKPHYECIMHICHEFRSYRSQMEMRFTIGSLNPELSAYWEPGAPLPDERLRSLAYATEQGFSTSVSMEPILAGRVDAVETFNVLKRITSGQIWIGKMNGLPERMIRETMEDLTRYEAIGRLQSNEEIIELYRDLRIERQVCWKDSIKEIVRNI